MNAKTTKQTGGWSGIRKHLATWDCAALLALVKDLYDTSSVNRDFLKARCQAEDSSGDVVESYRDRIVEQFYPKRGNAKLKLSEARKAIREYGKATGNLAGTAELMMTYVENGAQFTHDYGDIDERFYNSVESVLQELVDLLMGEGHKLYPVFRERLAAVEELTDGIGWGFHDAIADMVSQLGSQFSIGWLEQNGQPRVLIDSDGL